MTTETADPRSLQERISERKEHFAQIQEALDLLARAAMEDDKSWVCSDRLWLRLLWAAGDLGLKINAGRKRGKLRDFTIVDEAPKVRRVKLCEVKEGMRIRVDSPEGLRTVSVTAVKDWGKECGAFVGEGGCIFGPRDREVFVVEDVPAGR